MTAQTPAVRWGRALRRAIERRGMTPAQAIRGYGLTPSAAHAWLAGERLPDLAIVTRLADDMSEPELLALALRLRTVPCAECGEAFVAADRARAARWCSRTCSNRAMWRKLAPERASRRSHLAAHRLARHVEAVARYCGGCEPAGVCFVADCDLRDVSPLPHPYYADDHVTLYHADCLELLPFIEADVLVTDPPYGIGYSPAAGGRGWTTSRGVLVRGDEGPFAPAPLLALGLPTVLFGGNHYADRLPASPTWLVWDKRDGNPPNDFADCEMAWSNLGGPARLLHHRWQGLVRDSELRQPRVHPTQKPVALMRWVLQHPKMPPGTVLDPFAGSGSTLVAAKSLGRKAIGIEIEERYCEVAANRLRQEVLGLEGIA